MRCCRCSTCGGSRWATSRRRSGRCGQARREPAPSAIAPAAGLLGRPIMRDGNGATWRRGGTSISGDGIYLQARMEPQAECMLVLIGATPEGRKELLGFQVGCARARRAGGNCWSTSRRAAWPSRPSWPPVTGRSASGRRLEEVSPTTRHQRCTVHTIRTQSQFRGRDVAAV